MPAPIVLDCDPGHDDAIALLLALESDLCRGRTVVDLWRRTEHALNAHDDIRLDADGFFELLVERNATLG